MKKLVITFIIFFAAIAAHAQLSKEAADFNKFTIAKDSLRQHASKQKDYQRDTAVIDQWFTRYNELSPALRADFKYNAINMYYNMACYQNRLGKKAAAVNALGKAYAMGYIDYAFALNDSDLSTLHDDQAFKDVIAQMREKGDYGYLLKESGPYQLSQKLDLPAFTYQPASSPELVAFKNKFNLDSVKGNGDEISQFKNLLFWVHNEVRHDGNSNNPPSKNGIDLIAVCKKENRGVNCRMLATILKDACQAEGFKTRIVTCMPKDTADFDCHVITVVWSKTLHKWIWMDPTFNAYVRDEKGNYLNIEEVRERLVKGDTVVLNDDANWNNTTRETKEEYFRYMSKNLYWLKCSAKSEWDIETRKDGKAPIQYINLYPGSYSTIHQPVKTGNGTVQYASNNPDYFWQKPEGE